MKQEFVFLFQNDVGWPTINKYLGKDLTVTSNSSEEIVVNALREGRSGECRIYVDRSVGLVSSGSSRIKLVYDEGSMVVGGQELKVREMVLSYISGRQVDCVKLAVRLAKKYRLILENRTHEKRAADLLDGLEFGRSDIKEFSAQKASDALEDLIWWHLCGISQASAEFDLHSEERLAVRRLRVEIRKLRAVMTMLENILLPESLKWQEKMRAWTIKLARTRELDVAATNWRRTVINNRELDVLAAFFKKERSAEMLKVKPAFDLLKVTPVLLDMMVWAVGDPFEEGKEDVRLEKVMNKKLVRWFKKMHALVEVCPEFSNDELAHEVRIKAKAARYVMQSMAGRVYGDSNRITRNLKRLQDALGVLHDNYVNEEIAQGIVKKQTSSELAYQAGIFVGGERAQSVSVRKLLPDLWEKVSEEWEKWYEKEVE